MTEAVHVARTKNESTAKLEWIFELKWILAECVLAVPGRLGALACRRVVGAQQVQDIRFAKSDGLMHLAVVVNQQREIDPGFVTKVAGVVNAAEPDSDNVRSLLPECCFGVTQLRDMLTAENSTPVSQKHNDRGLVRPERA